jgi:hypothetical protein
MLGIDDNDGGTVTESGWGGLTCGTLRLGASGRIRRRKAWAYDALDLHESFAPGCPYQTRAGPVSGSGRSV